MIYKMYIEEESYMRKMERNTKSMRSGITSTNLNSKKRMQEPPSLDIS